MLIQKGIQDNTTQDLLQVSQRDQAVQETASPEVVTPKEETSLSPSDETQVTPQIQGQADEAVNFAPTMAGNSEEMFIQPSAVARVENLSTSPLGDSQSFQRLNVSNLPRQAFRFRALINTTRTRAQNGDRPAGRRLVYAHRVRRFAENNPEQARNIYDTLQRMAQDNVRYEDLSAEEQQYLQLIGINSQEDIDNAGGLEELYNIFEASVDVLIHPENYTPDERDEINELFEQMEAEGLFEQLAMELDMLIPELDLNDPASSGISSETTEEEEKPEARFEPNNEATNFDERLNERRQQTFFDFARDNLSNQEFQNELAAQFINKLNEDVQRTDEHARQLLEERIETDSP